MILLYLFARVAIVVIAAAAPVAPYFTPPPGWTFDYPPPEMVSEGMVAIWQPAVRNGENITLSIYARGPHESLADAQAELIREEKQDGRDLISIQRHRTCHGTADGTDVTLRFGALAEQLYHLCVKGQHVYSIMYTHSAEEPSANPSVLQALDSFCPP